MWVVTCDPELQMQRLQAARGFSSEQAQRRIANQHPQSEKVKHATSVIDNRDSLDRLREAVKEAWQRDVEPYLVQSSPP